MKYQYSKFAEFLKTPFPYLFLVLCIFLASTMLSNKSFFTALDQNSHSNSANSSSIGYELCLVCSDPAAKDALADLGFTVANFVLFPVSALAFSVNGVMPYMFAFYIMLAGIYGVLLPFVIFMAYEAFDSHFASRKEVVSVYAGSSER